MKMYLAVAGLVLAPAAAAQPAQPDEINAGILKQDQPHRARNQEDWIVTNTHSYAAVKPIR
jgi:hypothetical protein